jgi:hypothetical protein
MNNRQATMPVQIDVHGIAYLSLEFAIVTDSSRTIRTAA